MPMERKKHFKIAYPTLINTLPTSNARSIARIRQLLTRRHRISRDKFLQARLLPKQAREVREEEEESEMGENRDRVIWGESVLREQEGWLSLEGYGRGEKRTKEQGSFQGLCTIICSGGFSEITS